MNMVEDAIRKACAPQGPGGTCPGKVTLVGSGPGDPELLTLRAVKALRGARLVLYDQLVSKEVLRFAGDEADLIYVGKHAGHHTMPQEDIIDLMVRLALSGRNVVRLKGGDGFIFGRGGEEAQALALAGIPFEVIPGISAAQGAGAYAGIPLTHRDHAATLVYATGHLRGEHDAELDWEALARPRQTVVFYMGIANLPVICRELQNHGLPGSMPAALVEQASLPTQRCICGTLKTLTALAAEHQVKPPALIIVGEVVSLQPVLAGAMQAPTSLTEG
ncbi:uroporphyrinogen-III C-methyltransferase [Diaphorobacter sp. HDW4A]|uniref:uroporphyrinogen-III C-methyltransferase n=1 Tax=Diaphorobacter sp. HDW4A TaxID=2714924 RepID=UPI00140B282C|nr:uroporphyrinogen-III C-methyltransferase [Diaphorobacter sp. HDW4A]